MEEIKVVLAKELVDRVCDHSIAFLQSSQQLATVLTALSSRQAVKFMAAFQSTLEALDEIGDYVALVAQDPTKWPETA